MERENRLLSLGHISQCARNTRLAVAVPSSRGRGQGEGKRRFASHRLSTIQGTLQWRRVAKIAEMYPHAMPTPNTTLWAAFATFGMTWTRQSTNQITAIVTVLLCRNNPDVRSNFPRSQM